MFVFLIYVRPVVLNHLWKGRQRIFYEHSCITFGLSEFRVWVIVGCYNGSRYKMGSNHWPRRFSQNKDGSLDSLPTVLLYCVELLKIHMWVAPKWETVIEGINIINSLTSKTFQAHALTRTWRIRWKTIGKNILTSLAYLIRNCEWMVLLTRLRVASTGIFSTKYNLNIYMENSFKLLYILQAIKKSNIYIGYTKYIRMTPIENV